MLIESNLVLFRQACRLPAQVASPLQRQTLDQQAGGHITIGRQHQPGVELLALQHVVLQHVAELLQFLVTVTKQRHHPLVRLLTREAIFWIQRDGTFTQIVQIHHGAQAGARQHGGAQAGRGAQGQIWLHLSDCQFDRAITKNLQNQRAIEFDVGLHQAGRRHHFTQKILYRQGVGPGRATCSAAAQNLGPALGHPHQHASHWQAFKQKFVQFRHRVLLLNGLAE